MSESSSSVPGEIADADGEAEESSTQDTPSTVELDIDQDKVEAWDDVKDDYAVDPDGEPVPNSMDQGDRGPDESPEADSPKADSPEAEADDTSS